MKMLNRTGPSIEAWGALLVTGLQLDCVLLIITLCSLCSMALVVSFLGN